MINIKKKKIKGLGTLLKPDFQPIPFFFLNQSGNKIEGEDLFHPAAIRVDRKGNALCNKCKIRGRPFVLKFIGS